MMTECQIATDSAQIGLRIIFHFNLQTLTNTIAKDLSLTRKLMIQAFKLSAIRGAELFHIGISPTTKALIHAFIITAVPDKLGAARVILGDRRA